MTYTGRSRTLTFSATFSGSVDLTILDPQGDTDDQGFTSPFTVSTGLGEAQCYFRATWDRTTAPIFQDTEAQITLVFPWGVTSSYSDINRTFGNTSRAISGGYTFTATVYEAFDVYPLPDNDGDGFPTYGGPASPDGTPGLGIRYYEVVKDGDPVTISVDFGSGYSFSATENAVGDWVVPAYFRYYNWFPALSLNELDAVTASWTITHVEPTDPAFSLTDTWTDSSGSSIAIGYSADVLSVSASVGGPDWAGVEGLILGIVGPPTDYAVRARATGLGGALGAAIPASLKRDSGPPLAINLPSGSDYTGSHKQRDYDLTVRANLNAPVTSTLRGVAPVQMWLQPPLGTDDDPRDWRCQALGTRWLSGTVSHAAATVRDDGSATSGWAAGANTTVTTVGGAIRLAVSGGTGSVTRTFTPEEVTEAYRYLRLRVRSTVNDNRPLELSLQDGDPPRTKRWSYVTGLAGSYGDWDVDLCRPKNEVVVVDGTSSRYPLTDAEGIGKPQLSEPYFGVNRLNVLTIGGLVDGETYEIDFIESRRTLNPYLWVSPSFDAFTQGWVSGGSTTTIKPFLYSHVEGRTADIYAQRKTGTTYVQTTVSELWSRLTGLGGWSVIEGPGSPDGYHTNARDALYLGGSGTTWNSGWEDWHDKEITGTTQVYASALWDAVQVYPGAGDVWTGTAPYGGDTPVRYSKRLRHNVHGIVFDVNAPAPGEAVSWVRISPVQIRGTGTSAANGTYATGTPWGFGERDHKAILSGFGSPSVLSIKPGNRARRRACFAVVDETAAGSLSYDVSPSGRHVRTYPQTAGLTLEFAPNSPEPLVWAGKVLTLQADRASVVWARRTRQETLYLAVEKTGSVTVYTSADDGASLATVEVVTGTSPLLLTHEDGGVVLYYRNSGGTVAYRRYSAGALTTSGGTGLACADSGLGGYIAAASAGDPERTVILYVVGGNVTRATSNDGAAFSGATTIGTGVNPFGASTRDGLACEGWIEAPNARARFVNRRGDLYLATATLKAAEAAALDWSSMGPGDLRAVLLTLASGTVASQVSRGLTTW